MIANVFDSNCWMYPDSTNGKKEIVLTAAKNSFARAQFMLECDKEGEEICLSHTGKLKADFYELLEVYVNRNSDFIEERDYAHATIEEMKGHYTKMAPFQVYDPILPIANNRVIAKPKNAIFVKFEIPGDLTGGIYEGGIHIQCGGETLTIPYHITVGEAVVKRDRNFKLTHWINLNSDVYGCEPLSDKWWDVLLEMLRLAKEAGQNTIMPPVVLISFDGEHFFFDKVDFLLKKCFDMGYQYVEGPHLSGVFKRFYREAYPDFETGKDTVKFCEKFMRDWYAYLRQNGYDTLTYQHIFDEPREVNAALYTTLCSLAKECMPGVATMDAILTQNIECLPDVLVPTTRFYQLYKEEFDKMIGDNHKLWLYTCCWPSAPYLNRFLDMPLLWTRLIFWLCKQQKAEGYLHWALDFVAKGQNPYLEPSIPFKIFDDSLEQYLPAGDTCMIYPYQGRPIGSMRLEMVSAAMDDMALLDTLDDTETENLLSACLTENWTAAVDAEAFRELHRKLCLLL